MYQAIPPLMLLDGQAVLHNLTRSGRLNTNWIEYHRDWHQFFSESNQYVHESQLVVDPTYASVEYMTWYGERTVVYITDPSKVKEADGFQGDGETTELLMDGLCRMYYKSLDLMGVSDERHANYFREMRDIASYYMHKARGQHRLEIR